MSEPERLPAEVEALLPHERARGGPSPEQAARLSLRLLALVPPVAPPIAAPTAPTAPTGPTAPTPPPPAAPLPGASAVGPLAQHAPRLLPFLAVFALGVGAGAGLHASLTPSSETSLTSSSSDARSPMETRSAHERPPAQALPIEHDEAPAQRATEEDSPTRALPEAVSAESSSAPQEGEHPAREEDDTARDLALIERARVALARGQSSDALRVLAEHRRRFSRRSVEERDALTVQALAASGAHAEASAQARSFLARYPRSLFRSVVAPMVRDTAADDESERPASIP